MNQSTFTSAGHTLFHRWLIPESPRADLAIIHGYGDHSGRYQQMMQHVAERGIATHAVDLRGQGRSTGRRGFVRRWEHYLDDLNAFLALPELSLQTRGGRPLFLLGHSHGGLIVAAAGERGLFDSQIAGCIFSAPFLRPRLNIPRSKILLARLANPIFPWLTVESGVKDTMMTADPQMRAESRADPHVCRVATPRWFLGQRIAQGEVLRNADKFRRPMLVLMGSDDPIADPAAADEFYRGAGSTDKHLQLYPGLLHELLREADRVRVYTDIEQWMEKRIETSRGR